MLRSVLQAGTWIGVVLLFPFLLLAVVVGGCTGGDQQRDREEQTPTPLATASEDGGAGQTPTPTSVNSTHNTVTATPTELVDGGPPAYCNAPGHWGSLWAEPFEKHFLTWTADGRHLVFDDGSVFAISVVDGSLRQVALANRGPVGLLLGIVGSVSDDRLVFTTCLFWDFRTSVVDPFPNLPDADPMNYTYELAAVDLQFDEGLAGETTRLTRTPEAMELHPSWAPDGERFAYLVMDNSYHDFDRARIHIASADGEVLQSFSMLRGIALAPPQWSPDGHYLAVLSSEGEADRRGSHLPRQNLYTIELEGRQLHRISEATGSPSWSPDSEVVAFGKGGEEGSSLALYVAGPDGADVRRVAPSEGGFPVPEFKATREGREEMGRHRDLRVSQVAWSPDGEHILVVVEEQHVNTLHRNTAAIYVVTVDGSDMWRLDLDDHLPAAFRAAWSPDGKRIAVRVDRDYPERYRSDYQSLLALLTVAWDGTDTQVLIETQRGYRGEVEVGE